eukprot:12421764-Karenia_brevis.AAC.1
MHMCTLLSWFHSFVRAVCVPLVRTREIRHGRGSTSSPSIFDAFPKARSEVSPPWILLQAQE